MAETEWGKVSPRIVREFIDLAPPLPWGIGEVRDRQNIYSATDKHGRVLFDTAYTNSQVDGGDAVLVAVAAVNSVRGLLDENARLAAQIESERGSAAAAVGFCAWLQSHSSSMFGTWMGLYRRFCYHTHRWVWRRAGGPPDAAESYERVSFCERCGIENQGDPAEFPHIGYPQCDAPPASSNPAELLRDLCGRMGWPVDHARLDRLAALCDEAVELPPRVPPEEERKG